MKVHWTKAIVNENERLKKEIEALRFQPLLAAFANEVGNNIMLMLANKPFIDWPDLAKTAYAYAAHGAETTAHFYKASLPKRGEST